MSHSILSRLFFPLIGTMLLAAGSCINAGEPEQLRDFLGEKAMKVLSAPDRVEVFRVDHLWSKTKRAERFAGYPLISKGKDQGKEFAARLADVVRKHDSYTTAMNGTSRKPANSIPASGIGSGAARNRSSS